MITDNIYLHKVACGFVCVSRFVCHTTKGRGVSCYGKGNGDVGVSQGGWVATLSLPYPPLAIPSRL